MHLAIIKRRCSLKVGGSERYCVNLTRQLTARGHQVTVIGESIDPELKDEIDFIPVPISRWTSSTKNHSFAVKAGIAAKRGKFDLVYALGRSFGVDVVRVTERLQAHWVNVYYQQGWVRTLQKLNPRHRTLINLERQIYQADTTRRIITQSTLDRALLIEYYLIDDHKIRTIPNGIDTRIFNPACQSTREAVRKELGISLDVPLLIFASMDFEGKGLRTLIEGLADPKLNACELLVLGTGPIAKFKRIAESLNVISRIHFLGRRNQIERYYGAGDLFVLPTEYEPFPNVNLEAMACGLPVITTRNSGSIDFLEEGKNGYFLSSRQAREEFVKIVDQFLRLPPNVRQSMNLECSRQAATFTIERNIEATLNVFNEITTTRRVY